MSTGNELNKALSAVYKDLESLQSAREQVEIVTKSSAELTKSTSKLLDELNSYSNQFGKENIKNVNKLTKNLVDFENKINAISKKGEKSISEYILSFTEQIVIVIDKFSKQISENETNLTAINSLNNRKISEKIKQFEKSTIDLKINAEQGVEDIKSIAISKIKKQEKEISKTIDCILKINSRIEKLIGVITNYDIPNSLESLNQKLEAVAKENKLLKTMLFVIIGLLAINTLGLLINFIY